ncbi:MAG: hypothetical protein ABJA83_09025 [Burkholderiaceae bacterium]
MTVTFRISDAKYAEQIEEQKEYLRQVADTIERGSLEGVHLKIIADVLRDVADKMPTKRKRGRGSLPTFDSGGAALRFAILTGAKNLEPRPGRDDKRRSPDDAISEIAEEAGVEFEAMKKALKKQGNDFNIRGPDMPRDLKAEAKYSRKQAAARRKTKSKD